MVYNANTNFLEMNKFLKIGKKDYFQKRRKKELAMHSRPEK